jgi:hypothetical protein
MTILADYVGRPENADFVLFIHVLGALTLTGAIMLSAASLAAAWRNGSEPMLQLSFRSLLWAALPAWLVMRVAAELIADKEGLNEEGVDLAWVNVGYIVSELSLLLIIAATVLAHMGLKRTRAQAGSGTGLDRTAAVLVGLTLVLYLVAIWAMTAKPI